MRRAASLSGANDVHVTSERSDFVMKLWIFIVCRWKVEYNSDYNGDGNKDISNGMVMLNVSREIPNELIPSFHFS